MVKLDKEKLRGLCFPIEDDKLLLALEKELNIFLSERESRWHGISDKRDKQNIRRLINLYECNKFQAMHSCLCRISEGSYESICDMTINYHPNGFRLDKDTFIGNEAIFCSAAHVIVNSKAKKVNQAIFRSLSTLWSYINYKYPDEKRSDCYKFISDLLFLLDIDDFDSVSRSLRRYKIS